MLRRVKSADRLFRWWLTLEIQFVHCRQLTQLFYIFRQYSATKNRKAGLRQTEVTGTEGLVRRGHGKYNYSNQQDLGGKRQKGSRGPNNRNSKGLIQTWKRAFSKLHKHQGWKDKKSQRPWPLSSVAQPSDIKIRNRPYLEIPIEDNP